MDFRYIPIGLLSELIMPRFIWQHRRYGTVFIWTAKRKTDSLPHTDGAGREGARSEMTDAFGAVLLVAWLLVVMFALACFAIAGIIMTWKKK